MLLTHKIKIPIYNRYITFVVGDWNEVHSYILDIFGYNVTGNGNTCDGMEFQLDSEFFIWLREDAEVKVLVHELSHAVFDIMEYVGLKTSDQEAFCYLIEFLMNECKSIFAIQMDPIKVP